MCDKFIIVGVVITDAFLSGLEDADLENITFKKTKNLLLLKILDTRMFIKQF